MAGRDDDNRSDFDRLMAQVGADLADTKADLDRMVDDLKKQLPRSGRQDEQQLGNHHSNKSRFERFKGFVDTNFALLSDGFKNFPSNVQELKERMQAEREARREEELDIWRRWTGSDDSPDHIQLQADRASKDDKQSVTAATFMLLRESFERNRHVPAQKILDLYRDDEWSFGSLDQFATPVLSFGGACYYKPESVENLPSTARWGWPAPSQKWLSVEWFKRSQYSPIRLEAHADLAGKGEKWRAAFEDLLLTTLDKPMQTTEKIGRRIPVGKPQSTYHGPGLDWMLSLQCRGILPPQLPNLYGHYRNEGGRVLFKPAHTRVIPDLDAITSQRSHCMYPRAESDLHALMDEVGIQAQPETDAFSLHRADIPQSPWEVPDTEAELYEQMQPQLLPTPLLPHATDKEKREDLEFVKERLREAIDDGNYLDALEELLHYETIHGQSDNLLGNFALSVPHEDVSRLQDRLEEIGKYDSDVAGLVQRLVDRVQMNERWLRVFERGHEHGVAEGLEWAHAMGVSVESLEEQLDTLDTLPDVSSPAHEQQLEHERRIRRALQRADKLGYDFVDWDWKSLPLEELEGELDREEAYTAARRKGVLAKAARLGYDFNGWEYEGLPVQELEDEMLRMEQYTKRDAKMQSSTAGEAKGPNVLSQLTTTETVRLPDGTVTTRVVLKRRFADGREETKESVQTSNEQALARVAEQEKAGAGRHGKKKGWFWT